MDIFSPDFITISIYDILALHIFIEIKENNYSTNILDSRKYFFKIILANNFKV